MTVRNKIFRDDVRSAIKGAEHFADFSQLGIWDKGINSSALPAFGAGVPRWNTDLHHSHDSSERTCTLIVVVKRAGGGLEDLADEDSAEIERLVCELLDSEDQEVSLQECTYQEDTGGEQTIATLSMMFVIKYWPENS